MKLESTAFKNFEILPGRFTCDGENISPPLKFIDVPKEAKSLVIILEDPDAPMQTFTHWILFNIDPKISKIDEGEFPEGAKLGKNDEGVSRYFGSCPPSSDQVHSYHFTLYALDSLLNLEEGVSKNELLEAMENHILDTAELVGLYQRP